MDGANVSKSNRGKGRAIQKHHISYQNPEWIVPIYKGEHEIATKLTLYSKKTLSHGLIVLMLDFIAKNFDRAIKLGEEIKR
jgi:hypothetical protein